MRIVVAGSLRRTLVEANLFLVSGDLIFKRADTLSRGAQTISLAIKTFITMATHAAALIEKIAPEIQRIGALCHAVFGVTLLAACFGIFFFKHRPEPKFILAVRLQIAGRRATVAPVTTRATKAIRVVNLQQFLVWVTDEGA